MEYVLQSETIKWLKLHLTEGIGLNTFLKLLSQFHDIDNILKNLKNLPKDEEIEKLTFELARNQVKILKLTDVDYPEKLKELLKPPPILYLKGNFEILKSDRMISIIGARLCSSFAFDIAFDIAHKLSKMGYCIVSGYAQGIDTAAHCGALSANGKTIMVIPFGILNFRLHPEIKKYNEKIKENTLIISECRPYETWHRGFALRRNRITAALGNALIIVDSGHKGGVIKTAEFARALNKKIFLFEGCKRENDKILKQMGAKLFKNISEILCEFAVH